MDNNTVRERLLKYHEQEPVIYTRIGMMIGLTKEQSKYTISRFLRNITDLNNDTLVNLSDFLESRGY